MSWLLLGLALFGSGPPVPGAPVPGPPVSGLPAALAPDTGIARVLPDVVVHSGTNAVRLIAIDVPPEFLDLPSRFRFVGENGFKVMGRLSGTIAARDRTLVFSVVVPARAAAGPSAVGAVRFECMDGGCAPAEIAVSVHVDAEPGLQVVALRPLVGAAPGARVATEVQVANTGNATLLVTLSASAPAGWDVALGRVQIPLASGASATVPVVVRIPPGNGTGDYGVVISAAADGVTARGSIQFTLQETLSAGRQRYGLAAASAVLALDETGNPLSVLGAEIDGPVAQGIRVRGRGAMLVNPNVPDRSHRSLGRMGLVPGTGTLFAEADTWRAGIGSVDLQRAGLAGAGLSGLGAHVSGELGANGGEMLAVSPWGRTGHQIYAAGYHRFSRFRAGALLSDLRETAPGVRSARTLAATAEMPWEGGAADFQAGYRDTPGGGGFAYLAQAGHYAAGWGMRGEVSHTPGGSEAYARAEDQASADGYLRLNERASLTAAYWRSGDGRDPDSFMSSGTTLGSFYDLGSAGSLQVQGRLATSRWAGEIGRFDNAERDLRLGWNGRFRDLHLSASASHGLMHRTSALSAELGVETRGSRSDVRLGASGDMRYGVWQLDAAADRSEAGLGMPRSQLSLRAAVDRLVLVPDRLSGRAQIQIYRDVGGSARVAQVAGAEIALGTSMRLVVDLERNGMHRGTGGDTPWTFALQLERDIRMPGVRAGGTSAAVFADLNGNGRRDTGEHGMDGVVVEVGRTLVTTDARGSFHLPREGSPARVDPRSLPAGWVAGPRTGGGSALDLPVVPTRALVIDVQLGPGAMAPERIDMRDVVLILTDSLGRQWTGVPDSAGILTFGSLRPGVYEIDADLSGLPETLLPPSPRPTIDVAGGSDAIRVEFILSPRPLRIESPGRIYQIGPGNAGQAKQSAGGGATLRIPEGG